MVKMSSRIDRDNQSQELACRDQVSWMVARAQPKKHYTSCVSTTGGPLDLNLKVAFPEPTALEASVESTDVGPRLVVLGPMPSAEKKRIISILNLTVAI